MVPRSHKKNSLSKIISILKYAFGLAVLITLIYYIGVNNIFDSIGKTNLLYLPIILALYLLFLIFSCLGIRALINKNIPLPKIFKYTCLSWIFGLILPGKLGEFSIVLYLKKEGLTISHSFVITFLDKLFTFLFVVITTLFGLFLFFDIKASIFLILLFFSVAILIFILTNSKFILFFVPKRYKSHVVKFFHEYNLFFKDGKDRIKKNITFTMLKWIVNTMTVFFIFLALGITINIFYILVINSITALASLIPISANGLGIRQPLGIYLFSKINVNPAVALNMYLISLSLTYLTAFLFYAYYSLIHRGEVL